MLGFQHIEALYGLAAIPVLIILFLILRSWRRRAYALLGDANLVNQLVPQRSEWKKTLQFIFLLLALTSIILAIANLRMGIRKEKVFREGAEVIIAFDVSRSMLAEDILPNRLDRARILASKLISEINNDKVGLVVFAGNAYVQMPLTVDNRAALMYLNVLNTDVVPTQGTAIGEAIRISMEAFNSGEEKAGLKTKSKALIIITDGENHEGEAIEMAAKAKEEGILIYTIGVGTPQGAPIPVYRRGVKVDRKKDNEGNIVLSKLNESMLKEIALETGGAYFNLASGNQLLKEIKNELEGLDKTEGEEYQYTAYRNHFQVFLGIALLMLLLEMLMSERKSEWLNKIDIFKEEQKK